MVCLSTSLALFSRLSLFNFQGPFRCLLFFGSLYSISLLLRFVKYFFYLFRTFFNLFSRSLPVLLPDTFRPGLSGVLPLSYSASFRLLFSAPFFSASALTLSRGALLYYHISPPLSSTFLGFFDIFSIFFCLLYFMRCYQAFS